MASNDSKRKPVIGLTTYLEQAQTGVWDVQAAFLPKNYFEAVNNAGGVAVLIPPQPVNSEIAHTMLDRLDGLIICGGKDVNPQLYGQTPHPETDAPRRDRDELEHALLSAAISRGLPFLGICRGAQMLNVHRGGTLTQHLPEIIGDNRYQQGGGNFTRMNVDVEKQSLLSHILGGSETVEGEMYHHQSIDQVGHGLKVVARTADNVIEAIELDEVPFGLAVQWHPEQTPNDIRLFEGLIAAAHTHAEQRELTNRMSQ